MRSMSGTWPIQRYARIVCRVLRLRDVFVTEEQGIAVQICRSASEALNLCGRFKGRGVSAVSRLSNFI